MPGAVLEGTVPLQHAAFKACANRYPRLELPVLKINWIHRMHRCLILKAVHQVLASPYSLCVRSCCILLLMLTIGIGTAPESEQSAEMASLLSSPCSCRST